MTYGSGTWALTLEDEKNDSIDATHDVPAHRSNKTKMQEKEKRSEEKDLTDDGRSRHTTPTVSHEENRTSIGRDPR